MSLDPEVSLVKKRPFGELSYSIGNENTEINFVQLKKVCLNMEERIHRLETTWMRKYIINCNFTNVLLFFL